MFRGEKGEKNQGEKSAGRFLSKHVATEDQLGVPRYDRLVEVEEDGFRGWLHWGKGYGNSQKREFPISPALVYASPDMKILSALFLSAIPVSAQIYADVSTTLGDFSIELYHEDSPKAVANLMTLAEGTRPWIDSTTRTVRLNTPYYDGIIFHRVIKDFMNQAGSPNGSGSDRSWLQLSR